MIHSEALCRVFRIRYGKSQGTAFTIEKEGKQYFVTAKHLFEADGFPDNCSIQLLYEGDYKTFQVEVKYHTNPSVDAVILGIKSPATVFPSYSIEDSSIGMTLGQDMYFLGFPYDYDNMMVNLPHTKTPTPFVKKACLSGISSVDGTLFLDGINNPGFSGGPVCYKRIGEDTFRVAGVINSYRFNPALLYDEKGRILPYYMKENTGIINACSIDVVMKILEM